MICSMRKKHEKTKKTGEQTLRTENAVVCSSLGGCDDGDRSLDDQGRVDVCRWFHRDVEEDVCPCRIEEARNLDSASRRSRLLFLR